MRKRTRQVILWLISLIGFLWLIFYIVSSMFLAGVEDAMKSNGFLVAKEALSSQLTVTIGLSTLGLIILALIIDKIVERNSG